MKGRAILAQQYYRPWELQELEFPRFLDNPHMRVVRLSALIAGRLYPPGTIPGTHFCLRLSRPQGHTAAEKDTLMKSSSENIGNRTHNLPVWSTAPQATAPQLSPPPVSCIYGVFNEVVNISSYIQRRVCKGQFRGGAEGKVGGTIWSWPWHVHWEMAWQNVRIAGLEGRQLHPLFCDQEQQFKNNKKTRGAVPNIGAMQTTRYLRPPIFWNRWMYYREIIHIFPSIPAL